VAAENVDTTSKGNASEKQPNKVNGSTTDGVGGGKKPRTKRSLLICPLDGCFLAIQ